MVRGVVVLLTVAALALAGGCKAALGGVTSGRFRGSDSWRYLDRFCFDGTAGGFDAEFLFPSHHEPSLLLYFLDQGQEDEWGGWNDVYNGEQNCSERSAAARHTSGKVYDLADRKHRANVELIDGVTMIRAKVSAKVTSSRSRWFFFAVGNCPSVCSDEFCVGGVDMYWSFNFTNGDGGNFYFGADESSVLATALSFLLLYVGLGYYAYRVRSVLQSLRKYHATVALLVFSIGCTIMRLVCETVGFVSYRRTGVTRESATTLAMVLASFSEFSLVLMLMLIMKGWTIVRRKISANGRMRLSIYLMVYAAVYWVCIVYYNKAVDPANIVYVYDTAPGYVLVALRLVLVVWVLRAQKLTLKKYNSKRSFYNKFTSLAALWAVSLPLLVMLNFAVAEYFRAKLLYGLELGILFVTHSVLILLYNPAVGRSFPFHATTTTMLHGNSARKSQFGYGSLNDAHLRQAADISRRIKHGISILQTFSVDLTTFLEEIDPLEDDLVDKDEELPGSNTAAVANGVARKVAPRGRKKRHVEPPPRNTETQKVTKQHVVAPA